MADYGFKIDEMSGIRTGVPLSVTIEDEHLHALCRLLDYVHDTWPACRHRLPSIQDITKYIEIFYHWQRLQPGLSFLSPVLFEQKYYAGLMAA